MATGSVDPPAAASTATAPAATLAAVSMKLPPFWPADPEVWFAQIEAQFTARGVTAQKTRFDYVVSCLSPEFATEARDLLLNPPEDRPYDTLKVQLIKRTAASAQHKLQQLISDEELGDRKPSQLLRRMQQLLGDTADAAPFLREHFLQRLPANVRMVLASTDSSTDLSKLAELADKVMEVATPTIANLSDPAPIAAGISSSEVKQLREEVSRLTGLVESLTMRSCPRSPSRPPRRVTSPSMPRLSHEPLCWYQCKYGDDAQKCREPCTRGLNTRAGH
jgi:hypothetical protein